MTKKDGKKQKYSLTSSKTWHLIKACFGYFKNFKLIIFLSVIAMLFVGASSAVLAWLVQPALDDIFINKDKNALFFIPFFIFLTFLAKGLFSFIQKYSMSYCGLKVLESIQNDLYTKIIKLPMEYYNETQIGMLMSRIINDVLLISKSLPAIIRLSSEIVAIIGLLGLVFYRDYYLALWALLVCPLAVYPIAYFGQKLRKIGRRSQSQLANISTFLQETLSGIQVVKAFANESEETKRFYERNSKYVRIHLRGKVYLQLSSPVMDLIGAMGAGLVIWYGGKRVIQGILTPGEFFSFMTALFLLYKPLKSISNANMDIQNALAGAERVFDILHNEAIQIEQSGQKELQPPFQKLNFKNLTFTYPNSTSPALKNIDLTVKAGEKVAIVGPSGSGKTTLVQLIPRFHDTDRGSITINGTALQDFTLRSLRRSIGIVSQDPFLFNMTVRNNIAYGQDDVSQETIEDVAKAAYAHDFISELQEGYDTFIGERGVKLSGGQKQRLTIARALLKNPPLLILDEATSALDTQAERIVQQALENLMKDRTSIIIAHRLSTVLSADRIVVMRKGEILDIGNHDYLLNNNELYARLYAMQFQDTPLNGSENVCESSESS